MVAYCVLEDWFLVNGSWLIQSFKLAYIDLLTKQTHFTNIFLRIYLLFYLLPFLPIISHFEN